MKFGSSSEMDLLCRQLRPVLGDKIDRIWMAYLSSNLDEQRDLLRTLKLIALKHFGSPTAAPALLLQPPPEIVSQGSYALGTVEYNQKPLYSFGMSEQEWLRSMLVAGMSGSGKTNLAYQILASWVGHDKNFVVFDWKTSYRGLLKVFPDAGIRVHTVGREVSPFAFNPLIFPPGTSPTEWVRKLLEIADEAAWVGEGVNRILEEGIMTVYQDYGVLDGTNKSWPTFADVYEWMKKQSFKRRRAEWADSAERTLYTLCSGAFGNVINSRDPIRPEELLNGRYVLECEGLSSKDKVFFIKSFLLYIHLYRLRHAKRDTFNFGTLVDEGHYVFSKHATGGKDTILEAYLREERELGGVLVALAQHASLLCHELSNCGARIMFQQGNNKDAQAAANLLGLDREGTPALGRLPVGTAVVRLAERFPLPFLIRVPLVLRQDRHVSDTELQERMKGYRRVSTAVGAQDAAPSAAEPVPLADKDKLTDMERLLLEDVVKYPATSLRKRYARLNISVRSGQHTRDDLAAKGIIKLVEISHDGGKMLLMEPTEEGWSKVEELQIQHGWARPAGVEHEFWKAHIAQLCRDAGYAVATEKAVPRGHIDLEVTPSGQPPLAIEIETGKSDIFKNIEKCLAAGYPRVILACTNRVALARAEEIVNSFAVEMQSKVSVQMVSFSKLPAFETVE